VGCGTVCPAPIVKIVSNYNSWLRILVGAFGVNTRFSRIGHVLDPSMRPRGVITRGSRRDPEDSHSRPAYNIVPSSFS